MTRPRKIGRTGASMGEVLVVLAFGVLLAALFLPFLRRAAFDRRLEEIVGGVEALRTAATAQLDRSGDWPPPAEPGKSPELSAVGLGPGTVLAGPGYAIQWSRVQDVIVPDLPPEAFIDVPETLDGVTEARVEVPEPTFSTRGVIIVHAGDEAVLGALLERYGSVVSFVRDTTWTLLLPKNAIPRSGP